MAVTVPVIQNLAELLQPLITTSAEIKGHTSKLLNAPGDNYGSLMLALEAFIEENGKPIKTMHMVAKLCPPNEWIKKMFATHITFKKEIKFYMEVLPTMIKFQKKHNVPEERTFNMYPKCLNARINLKPGSDDVDENAILLLENLKVKGYNTGERLIGLNLEETELVLKDLARFHAIPLSYKLSKPEEFKKYIFPTLNKVNIGQDMFDSSEQQFIESICLNLNLNESELERFAKGMRKGFIFQKNFPAGNEQYASIVHRDFWVNNTMILKDDNNMPIKNKILDFQVVTYGSPASDFVFFMYTSVVQSVLEKYYDHFIEIYHNEFIQCLKDVHCNTTDYTLKSFKHETELYGPLEASHIIIMFRAVYADREAVKNLTDFNMDEMFTEDAITDIYKERLDWTVKHFLDKNWF